ncbi:MAG: FAD-dependent oxidoreductase [Burkholderiales bacterium]|nr:FAD-dependent oxidoreductase [Burkholderiales bacterium]
MTTSVASFQTEVLVLGAGPAGMAAAAAAAQHGKSVTVVDENSRPGGQIWRGGPAQWRDRRAHALWNALDGNPLVRIVGGARLVARPEARTLLLESADGALRIVWERLVICSGARELLLPFPGWTLPGVTGAGGLQALIKGGLPLQGQRVVVAGSGPLLLAVADSVRRAGGQVLLIAEHRSTRELAGFFLRLAWRHPAKLRQALGLFWRLKRVPYLRGATVLAAAGRQRLHSITLGRRGRQQEIACDWLACGYGLLPNCEAASLLGCAVRDAKVAVDEEQATTCRDIWAAGEATGIGGVDKALAEGRIAGLRAAGAAMLVTTPELRARAQALAFAALLNRHFSPAPGLRELCKPDTLVCRCEDVRAGQLAGHGDWRSAKLLTRVGMGACQGRVCGAACQFLYGWQSPGLRPPLFPATASTLAALDAAWNKDAIE